MCVEGDIEVTQEDDPSLLEVTGGNKINELIPFCEDVRGGRIGFHVCTDYHGAPERCADVEGVPVLVFSTCVDRRVVCLPVGGPNVCGGV